MMEDVIGSIGAEWHQSEDTPWELIATVSIMSLQDPDDSPVHQCPEMTS